MFDINKILGKDPKESAKEKEKVAELLKVNPELLEEFEKQYKEKALDVEKEPNNFFDLTAEWAKKNREKNYVENNSNDLDEIVDKIVLELLDRSKVFVYNNEEEKPKLENKQYLPLDYNPVSNNDLNEIPLALRPQLTGNLMAIDLDAPSYQALLYFYKLYLDSGNKECYHRFRQGLDILDLDPITYQIIEQNQNSMGYWLPKLIDANNKHKFFKIPDTKILKVPLPLLQLTRQEYEGLSKATIDILDKYVFEVFDLDENKDYLVKTGTYSSKFDFRNAKVTGAKEVRELGEYLLFIHYQANMMASPLTNPCIYGVSTTNEWVVREYIEDKENNPTIYNGLPLHTEYRVFVDCDIKEVLSVANYWDEDLLKQRFGFENDRNNPEKIHDYIIYESHKEKLYKRFNDNKTLMEEKVLELIQDLDLEGQWSIDVMQNGEDFYLIDMAIAQNSALYNTVPVIKRKEYKENWIPEIEGPLALKTNKGDVE